MADEIEVNEVAMLRKGKEIEGIAENCNFAKSLQYLKKKGRNEIDFELFYKLMLSILVLGKASHAQSIQNNKVLQNLYKLSKKK